MDLFAEGRVDEYTVNPVLFLANGVTSTFPAGEVDPDEARTGRMRVASGEIPGPRIYSSGPYWGSARRGWSHAAMTPDSIRKEATYWALNGVRGFKAKGIRPEQLEVLVEHPVDLVDALVRRVLDRPAAGDLQVSVPVERRSRRKEFVLQDPTCQVFYNFC